MGGGLRGNEMTTHTLSAPVNLIGEINDESSGRCVRRVMARILGHAELNLAEAQYIWTEAGHNPELWQQYIPTFNALK